MLRAQFDSVVARMAQSCALVDGDERIAYAELAARTERFAFILARDGGIGPGACVAASLPNGWEFAAGMLGTAGLGAAWAPFHPEWRAREVAAHATRVAPDLLVTRSDLVAPWRESGALPPVVLLVDDPAVRRRLVVDGDRLPPLRHGAETPCAYLPTSGSTGRPRVALRTVGNLLAAARGPVAALSLRAGMREISVTPFHHTGGFDNGLLLPLLAGLTAVLQPVFDPSAFARTIATERIELMMASPFVYAMLLERGIGREHFASVEMAVSFGAPCSPALVRRCADELGLVVRQLYGSTETGVIAIQSAATPFAPGLAGTPVAGVEVRILGDDGTELPAGRTGVVAIGGPGVIARYRDATDDDANRFRDGLFRSGDLGCFDPQGVLMLRGRSSAMINLSGVKVDPVEIEHAIGEMPAVSDCIVRGVGDGGDTEFVEALVVTRVGHSLTRKALLEHCRQRLAEYKLPRRITFCASLPIDVAGKRRVDGEAAAP